MNNVFGTGLDWGAGLYDEIFGGAYIDSTPASILPVKSNGIYYVIGGAALIFLMAKK